eukprot:COSAG01_NODE_4892_length_4648_cov_3.866344_7_plen_81_part_01
MASVAAARTRAVDGALHTVVAGGVAVLVIGLTDGIIRAAMAIRAALPARVVRRAARVVVACVTVAHATVVELWRTDTLTVP